MAEWANEADAVCAEINAEVEALADPGNDLATFGAYIGRVEELMADEQTRLEGLDQPDGEAMPSEMSEYLERQLSLIGELSEASAEGDSVRVRSILDQSARELGPLGRNVAEVTGVEECATAGPVGGVADDDPADVVSTTSAPASPSPDEGGDDPAAADGTTPDVEGSTPE